MAEIIEHNFENIELVASRLKEGRVGIIPCDTIYGISTTVTKEGSEKIYEIKNRPQNKAFIILMTKKQVKKSSLIVPDDILALWPCALTAVLSYPDGSTVAVRVPSDEYLLSLLELSGPIYSTSVNISGEPSLLTFSDILPRFNDKVDFIVKSDIPGTGKSSTLVDATKKPYRILRQGSYEFKL